MCLKKAPHSRRLAKAVGLETFGNDWIGKGEHVDFGKIIYDDNKHGIMSFLMKGSYSVMFNYFPAYDYGISIMD